ncbi:hypothetical protein SAMN02927916_2505 [Flavobacterium anhuiense]|uniref:Secreted protein n=1 Tax=Flavobacterium anhuiense TaxID=459526 RepID=A0ABY0LUW7_9FLAO|nr:hypothetical protein SAMN02927916_2505 [Flavobacterium anhuiense]
MIFKKKAMQFASLFLFVKLNTQSLSFLLRRNDNIVDSIVRLKKSYFQCNSKAKHVFSPFVMLKVAVV